MSIARMPVGMEFSIARRKLVSCTSARLDLHAPAHVAPGAQQHPHRQHRQRHDHPEQRVADQADRGAVALAAQVEAVGPAPAGPSLTMGARLPTWPGDSQ
jgi:hypothetical protein